MAWTTPVTHATGDFISAAIYNNEITGNLNFLNALVPIGSIMMWSGTLATIPTNWHLCDGTNGTPNLLAKFVEGVATAATNPGATGGATSKNTAGHSHNVNYGNQGPTGSGGGYYLTATPNTQSATDNISDIRPPYYDLAFIMRIS